MAGTKNYLVWVLLEDHSYPRLSKFVPEFLRRLNMISAKKPEHAFNSQLRDAIGYMVQSEQDAKGILADLESTQHSSTQTTLLMNNDKVFVIELGEDHASRRQGTLAGWLQYQ